MAEKRRTAADEVGNRQDMVGLVNGTEEVESCGWSVGEELLHGVVSEPLVSELSDSETLGAVDWSTSEMALPAVDRISLVIFVERPRVKVEMHFSHFIEGAQNFSARAMSKR